uniref:Uncharacterized protein n=1 Tax=Anguilla anguilla TaxID=7936 RepID=A0A0E9SE47_ANGAN
MITGQVKQISHTLRHTKTYKNTIYTHQE